jgi:arylsulfatase A
MIESSTLRYARTAALVLAATTFAYAAPLRQPNIVIILGDDHGYASLGAYGAKGLKTPNMDRLAQEGRRFTQAYAPGSVCSPSRYALLTGRYYWRTNNKDGEVIQAKEPLIIETSRMTIGSLCKGQGYATAAIGKWHVGIGADEKTDWNGPVRPGPLQVGFDYFYGMHGNFGHQPNAYMENEQLIGRVPGEKVSVDNEGTHGIKPERVKDEIMRKVTEKAVDWIEKNASHPFLLYFAPNAIHEPIAPAPQWDGSSPYGKYGDFIQELDWSVGQVLDTLKRLQLDRNTLVIYTSDNGGVVDRNNANSMAAMKAGLAINGALRDGKHSIYEGGFREPFMARWPGEIPAGTVSHDIVCLSDVLATIAGILRAPLPDNAGEDSLDVGTSLFGAGAPARNFVVLQDARAFYAVREGPWKLVERENMPKFKSRSSNYERRRTAEQSRASKTDELYNLADDPSETKDVASVNVDVVKRLRALLNKVRNENRSRPAPSSSN